MKQGDLVLIRLQNRNVIGYILYLVGNNVSIQVDNSFKVQRGAYLVPRSEVKPLNLNKESNQWTVVC